MTTGQQSTCRRVDLDDALGPNSRLSTRDPERYHIYISQNNAHTTYAEERERARAGRPTANRSLEGTHRTYCRPLDRTPGSACLVTRVWCPGSGSGPDATPTCDLALAGAALPLGGGGGRRIL